MLSVISEITSYLLCLKFYILYGRCVTSGGWRMRRGGGGSFPALFQKLEKLESPGEKTGDFSLLDQANNNFLEKETCKL